LERSNHSFDSSDRAYSSQESDVFGPAEPFQKEKSCSRGLTFVEGKGNLEKPMNPHSFASDFLECNDVDVVLRDT
jgi:hypothetical protein